MKALDYLAIGIFFALLFGIAAICSRRAGRDAKDFFLSGRSMPWWLVGVSMCAASTSTNSANMFTEFIRNSTLGENWKWWAFLLTGMLTVFVFQAVGAFRREERHRVLRAALFGQGGGVSARVQVALPRHRVQRDHHRPRDARRDQDRAGALRRRPVDGDRGHVGRVGRLLRAGRIPRRDLHGLLPVHRDHGRRGGGHVLRGQPSGRGRILGDDGASRRAGASVVLPLIGRSSPRWTRPTCSWPCS